MLKGDGEERMTKMGWRAPLGRWPARIFMGIASSSMRRAMTAAFLFFFSPTLAVSLPAGPSQKEAPQELLNRCATYLNTIKTLEARFFERNSRGGTSSGKLYAYRPSSQESSKAFGYLRLVYDPPREVEIVADGESLFHYDRTEDDLNSVSLESTPIAFLLRPHISFSGDVTVRDIEKKDGLLRITLYQTEEPDAGALTLIFIDTPLELRQWMITDAQGVQTLVTLDQVKLNMPLHSSLLQLQRAR